MKFLKVVVKAVVETPFGEPKFAQAANIHNLQTSLMFFIP